MDLDELYAQIKEKRSHVASGVGRHKRQGSEQWRSQQKAIYARADGYCQSPLESPICQGKTERLGERGHTDHIVPLVSGGSNENSNLRLLCPVCHALRLDKHHAGLRGKMLKLDLLPEGWQGYLWEG